jgi:hypothetical protein
MIIIDKDTLSANLSLLEGMCSGTKEIVNTPNVDDANIIHFCNQILSTAHWLMQMSFINIPDPKPPEPMKEIQEP